MQTGSQLCGGSVTIVVTVGVVVCLVGVVVEWTYGVGVVCLVVFVLVVVSIGTHRAIGQHASESVTTRS